MGHTLENSSHFKKLVTLRKMAHTFKNESLLKKEKWVTLKNGSHFKNG